MPPARSDVLREIEAYFDDGQFETELRHFVAFPTESQIHGNLNILRQYLDQAIAPRLAAMGCMVTVFENPVAQGAPLLVGRRIEDPTFPTVLIYGHGDVVYGQAEEWQEGLDPFVLSADGERYYGRGTADNKGQHLINIAALETVLAVRGSLGFNVTFLMEMSEETGSTGLKAFCAAQSALLAADVLIASDGPRVAPEVPTIFLGSRGVVNFEVQVNLRDGARHSGNWGGLLRDPGVILAQALASITDARGQVQVPEWRPVSLNDAVKADLAVLPVKEAEEWNETDLSPAERVFGWNSFAVLALECGDPIEPQNAIQGSARAVCQLRFVAGTPEDDILPALQRHLDQHGFAEVQVLASGTVGPATRQDRDNDWVKLVERSLRQTSGHDPHVLPNLAGWIPNHCFSDVLGMPTVWVPHSYAGCSQHAPGEHVLKSVCRDALRGMVGVFWDIGKS